MPAKSKSGVESITLIFNRPRFEIDVGEWQPNHDDGGS